MTMKFEVPITFNLSLTQEQEDLWRDTTFWDNLLSEQVNEKGEKLYGAVTVTVESPHAEYIEYGTGPAQKGTGKPWKEFVKLIEKWCNVKLGKIDKEPRRDSSNMVITNKDGTPKMQSSKDRAYLIAKHILEHGIDPQPFFRPGIIQTLDECFDQDGLREGMTISDLADRLSQNIRRIYSEKRPNGWITEYGGPYRSHLDISIRDSLKVSYSGDAYYDARILNNASEYGDEPDDFNIPSLNDGAE